MGEPAVVFTSTVEGLIRALGDKLDERVHQQFADIGLPLKGKLLAAYSREVWLKSGLLASQLLFPTLPPEKQRVELGRRFVYGYSETIVGKALVTMMRMLGTRRALERLKKSFHTGNNYTEVALREVDGQLELDVSDAPFPEYYQGMVEAVLELTGRTTFEVAQIRRVGNETTFRIRFS